MKLQTEPRHLTLQIRVTPASTFRGDLATVYLAVVDILGVWGKLCIRVFMRQKRSSLSLNKTQQEHSTLQLSFFKLSTVPAVDTNSNQIIQHCMPLRSNKCFRHFQKCTYSHFVWNIQTYVPADGRQSATLSTKTGKRAEQLAWLWPKVTKSNYQHLQSPRIDKLCTVLPNCNKNKSVQMTSHRTWLCPVYPCFQSLC